MTFSALRLAFRLAFRDARRSKRRSVLVIVLLGLPVFTVAAGATVMDSLIPTPAETAQRTMGTADALVEWRFDEPIMQDPLSRSAVWPESEDAKPRARTPTAEQLLEKLPPDTRLSQLTQGESRLETSSESTRLESMGIDMSDPITEGILTIVDGETPRGNTVALSQAAADELDVRPGDHITMDGHDRTVAALVERPGATRDHFVAGASAFVGGKHDAWLVDTPEPVSWHEVRTYNAAGIAMFSQAVANDPPSTPVEDKLDGGPETETLSMIGFLAAMIGIEIVLLAGPAFAIGAKRRARELAILAATGATPAQVRRTVISGGIILGGASAVLSLIAGTAVAYAATPLVEYFAAQRAAGFRIWPDLTLPAAGLTILTGAAAATTPAFNVARQDIVSTLTGRRGSTRSRKRWVLLGLLLVGVGSGVAAQSAGVIAVPALLSGIALAGVGLVLCTPALVGLIGRLGRFLPLAMRMALREAGRHRSASAPAISAIMAVVAFGIAVSMFMVGDQERISSAEGTPAPEGYVSAEVTLEDSQQKARSSPVPATADDVSALMRRHLPVSQVHSVRALTCPAHGEDSDWCQPEIAAPENTSCPYDDKGGVLSTKEQATAASDPHCRARENHVPGMFSEGAFLTDAAGMAALTGADDSELDRAAKVMEEGGVVVNDPGLVQDGKARIELRRYKGNSDNEDKYTVDHARSVPAVALDSGTLNPDQVLYGETAASRLQLDPAPEHGLLAETDRPPQKSERESFESALPGNDTAKQAGPGAKSAGEDTAMDVNWEVARARGSDGDAELVTVILAILSGILTLGATAVASVLAASESRRELATLGAMGASPGIRRRLGLFQAGVISLLGAGLGVIAGIGACSAATTALNGQLAREYPRPTLYTLTPPWLNITLALVVVPLIAMTAAAILTRPRLPIERRGD